MERFNGPTNWDFCDPFCTVLLPPTTPVRTNADFLNMLVYNIPADVLGLKEGAGSGKAELPAGTTQGNTDFGAPGYGGACPPPSLRPASQEWS